MLHGLTREILIAAKSGAMKKSLAFHLPLLKLIEIQRAQSFKRFLKVVVRWPHIRRLIMYISQAIVCQ